ncbi:type II toxin-antitoxin system RatA family toxin [Luteimonas terrae]|uniref:Ribosome-associated toxin RatA of RatAB toxin-antitoxin module n=1 Tax=Luteimonas terrae TaxID=1530191 RepID=A0ABU1XWF8_9GAMM|nr:type II toxin-antitoxin system RatA family toxin [Luteimonas terrae]MDR7192456.1 ribosome-associated toxin RatA of RatAB toxin-antitoxin module [Luteimonas terrae]
MPKIERSALVGQPAERMYALVNDVAAYPRRFAWCDAAEIQEATESRMVARLDLGLGALRTWFTTENTLSPPDAIDMQLRDGPFKSLHGRWSFAALGDGACKVTLLMEFEPKSRLMLPALTIGFKGLADRMVDDFVRVAEYETAA